jgi:hypothetical protein
MESQFTTRLICKSGKRAADQNLNHLKTNLMKAIKITLAIASLIISGTLLAQTGGTIKGTIVDEKKNAMPFVPVAIMQDSSIVASSTTDINGEFAVKELVPGRYNLKASFTGYDILLLKGVVVNPNQFTYVPIAMALSLNLLQQAVVEAKFIEPAFDAKFATVTPISISQIENGAVGKTDLVAMIVMLTPGVMPTNDGKDLYIRGSRRGSTAYYVDGNKTMEVPDVPGMGISGMEVLTGGVPAMYGDCTGGLVIITTKEYKWEMARKQNEIDDRKESRMGEKIDE